MKYLPLILLLLISCDKSTVSYDAVEEKKCETKPEKVYIVLNPQMIGKCLDYKSEHNNDTIYHYKVTKVDNDGYHAIAYEELKVFNSKKTQKVIVNEDIIIYDTRDTKEVKCPN